MVNNLQLEVAKRGLFEKLNLNSVAKGLCLSLNGSVALRFNLGKILCSHCTNSPPRSIHLYQQTVR